MSTTQSRKARGRKLQQYVANLIRDVFHLGSRDAWSRSMGSPGTDVVLSEAAHKVLPVAIECKNQQRLDWWGAWEQAKANTEKGEVTLLVVKKNRSDVLAVVELEEFLRIARDGI